MAIAVENLLNTLRDPIKELGLIRSGIKTKVIEAFFEQEDFPVNDILYRLQISPSTYYAKKQNRQPLDAYTTEKFVRLISIFVLASNILGKEEAKAWLYRKVPSLGNRVPLDLLDTEVGHRLIEQALFQIKYSMYG